MKTKPPLTGKQAKTHSKTTTMLFHSQSNIQYYCVRCDICHARWCRVKAWPWQSVTLCETPTKVKQINTRSYKIERFIPHYCISNQVLLFSTPPLPTKILPILFGCRWVYQWVYQREIEREKDRSVSVQESFLSPMINWCVRLVQWLSVHVHHIGWRLVGRTLRFTLQTV